MLKDSTANIGQRSFFVIEDEEFSRLAVTKTLAAMGATDIATAADGIEALAHLDERPSPPDVMLLDIKMPNMGGAELLRHLADRDYQSAIILVSGANKDTIAIAGSLAGYRGLNILGHIIKPMTADTLSVLLDKLE